MAKTNRKRGGMRSTRSRKSKIVGGLNLKLLLFFVGMVIVFNPAEAQFVGPPSADQKAKDAKLAKVLTEKLGGIKVKGVYDGPSGGILIDTESIPQLQEFLEEHQLEDKIEVTDKGRIRAKGFSLFHHIDRLVWILNKI